MPCEEGAAPADVPRTRHGCYAALGLCALLITAAAAARDLALAGQPQAERYGIRAALGPNATALTAEQVLAPARTPAQALRATAAATSTAASGCADLGPGPHYRHGKYADRAHEDAYALTRAELEAARLGTRHPALEAFLRKLASVARVRIGVLGGSFTAGHECLQRLADGRVVTGVQCAWPGRFFHWLDEFFPLADAKFVSLIRPGTATCPHLVALPVSLKEKVRDGDLDLVILDTLVNGNQEFQRDRFCYELIIQAFHELSPSTVIFSILAGSSEAFALPGVWENVAEEERVVKHYGVPYTNFAALVHKRPALWFAPNSTIRPSVHPGWQTHQYLADLVAEAWGASWAAACASSNSGEDQLPVATPFPDAPYFRKDQLLPFTTCLRPVSSYSAYSPRLSYDGRHPGVSPTGSWRLWEQRAGKPGWVATRTHATASFRVTFGRELLLVVVYLRSYESVGSAAMTVVPQVRRRGLSSYDTVLEGLWEDKVSQAAVYRLSGRREAEASEDEHVYPGLRPGDSAQVQFKSLGPMFKVISVSTC